MPTRDDVSFDPAGVVNPLSRRGSAREPATDGSRKSARGVGRHGGKGPEVKFAILAAALFPTNDGGDC